MAAISLGRLKVARFSDLNDPFELLALALKGHYANKHRGICLGFNLRRTRLCVTRTRCRDPEGAAWFGHRKLEDLRDKGVERALLFLRLVPGYQFKGALGVLNEIRGANALRNVVVTE